MVHTATRKQSPGRLIRELRTELGLSPEDLAYAIYAAGHGSVSARTIRRVERDEVVPRVRAQFAIAQFFGRPVTAIWPIRAQRRRAAA